MILPIHPLLIRFHLPFFSKAGTGLHLWSYSQRPMSILFTSFILCIQVVGLPEPALKSSAAVYISEKSHVRFFSKAPLENIEATSTKLRAALNLETGMLLFVIPINSFQFEKQRVL